MWRSIVSAVTAVAMLAGGLYLALEKPEWVPGLEAPSDRVTVYVVGTPEGVDIVRAAVDPARIVASAPGAIALVEGRIIAASVEAATSPYTEAGWSEREIEFVKIEKNDRPVRGRRISSNEVDPDRMARLQELIHKPTLSYGEQVFVLQAMNDGLVF